MKLYFMRHAQSMANVDSLLASQLDYPLSDIGHRQADRIADSFFALLKERDLSLNHIICSPLLRARETAWPFEQLYGLTAELEPLLMEQHLGRFSGMSYEQLEMELEYEHDRTKRWEWIPPGGGESYRMLTDRVKGFLSRRNFPDQTLCVTHAVTMRLVYAVLADMLPSYPDWIPENGDIWEVDFTASGTPHEIIIHKLGNGLEIENRA